MILTRLKVSAHALAGGRDALWQDTLEQVMTLRAKARRRGSGNGKRACFASAALREEKSASGFGLFYCRIAKQKFKSRV